MRSLKKSGTLLIFALLLAVAGFLIYRQLHPRTLPANLIAGAGRIDGDLVRLNVKYPGRLERMELYDGDPVHRGELVASLSSAEFTARRDQAKALAEAKARELAAKKQELEIARRTIPLALQKAQAQFQSAQAARDDLQLQIEAAAAVVEQDRRDHKRTENLYKRGLIQKEQLEKISLKLRTDSDTLQSLQKKMAQADAALTLARTALEKAQAEQRRLRALEDEVAALARGVDAARAALREAQAALDEMKLHSPLEGFVVERIAQPGEVVGAGMPVATLIDPSTLYLKLYVDTLQNGRIKLGDRGEIFLDARPDRPIPAHVVRIAQQAEFTPKEVNVRSDRIQRVFAVHLKPDRPDPLLKLGIPAVGVISLDGRALPDSLSQLPPI